MIARENIKAAFFIKYYKIKKPLIIYFNVGVLGSSPKGVTIKMFRNLGHTALQWRKLGWLGRVGSLIRYFSQWIQLCLVIERLFKFHIVRKSKTHSFKKVICRKGLKLSILVIHLLLNLTLSNRRKITRDWRWEILFLKNMTCFWTMWISGEGITQLLPAFAAFRNSSLWFIISLHAPAFESSFFDWWTRNENASNFFGSIKKLLKVAMTVQLNCHFCMRPEKWSCPFLKMK